MNVTRRADGQWRSIENAEMFKEQPLMYEIYLSELAKGARDLGYEIAVGRHGNPELGHITRTQIEHFSRRSRQVEAELEADGLTRKTSTAGAKRAAALSTREAKKDYEHIALRAEWIERGEQIALQREVPNEPMIQLRSNEFECARAAVRFALEHLSEREAAFSRRDVLVHALRAARGTATAEAITTELDRGIANGEFVSDGAGQWLTTRLALETERRLLSIELQGRGAVAAIAPRGCSITDPSIVGLNEGQRSLVELVLTTQNRIIRVNGLAGTGKTTALSVALDLAEREGFQLVGLAPSHSAVRALDKSSIESQTVQRWLLDRKAESRLSPRSIVVVDEAGLAGTSTLRAVLERVDRSGARAVLVGDIHQYEAVEAGRGFSQLQQHGMQTADLSQMVRQRDPTLAEAARLSVHSPERALGLLPLIEERDAAERHTQMAHHFGTLSAADQAQTLLLTGSHAARRDINERVRAELGLSGSAERIRVFRALDKTAAEKRQLETYHPGLTIRFEKDYRTLGARRGDTAQVEDIFAGVMTVTLPDGAHRRMSPQRLNGRGWTVGVVEELEMAAGERVRFTGTNPRAGYRNGERGVVEKVSTNSLVIRRTDGSEVYLARDLAISLDYSYAATGHSAQGLDASRVILERDAQSRTTNRRSFYTDLTRARDSAVVFTDSALRLERRARVDRTKVVALDVAGQTGATSGGLELTKE